MNRTYNDEMFIKTFERDYTWLSGFLRNVRRYGKRKAIIDPDTDSSWNYEELNGEANKIARALIDSGIKKDDVVMAALRNSPAFAFTYTGVRKTGAILLEANFNLASGEMAKLIDHNKPKVLIYSVNIKNVVVESLSRCTSKPSLVIMADNIEKEETPLGHVLYDDFVKESSPLDFPLPFTPHIYDEVLRLCTSGTSALPKSVPLNGINEVLTAHDVIMHCALNLNDVTLNMTPWFHRGGCHSAGPCPQFYVGGSVVVMRSFQPKTALEWVEKYGVTFLIGAPANLNMLSKAQVKNSYNLSSLRGIIAMGSPLLHDDCIDFMKNLTPNIFNGYGTTETFWNSLLMPYDLPENAGSAGISCIDDEIRLVKIFDDRKAEPDELVEKDSTTEGEVIIKSEAKSTFSYFNDEKNEKEKFYKGWMYTGDTGVWNEKSFVTIKGRKDDMMVVSGENIYPLQIEEVLNNHPKIKDSAVTSVPDKIRGQAVVAYIVPEAGEKLTAEEISSYCTQSADLSIYKRPRYFSFIEELPMTASGKKIHSKLKAQAQTDFQEGKLQKL